MFGLKEDWLLEVPSRYFTLQDYEGETARWCPACGDHAVLGAVQRLCRKHQIPPEKAVMVSGIGCSSRLPHYSRTYGFHGLHGRALPVACGIKARRPDLSVWVTTGDGDCCSIGAGHWIHAVRYNMDLVVMLFDNGIYGLTKKQTSPTTPAGMSTNTHPGGSWLAPLNPLRAALGFTNVSFVAQTVDWLPPHLEATLDLAYQHRGLSFVRILQRCPTYTAAVFEDLQRNAERMVVLESPHGVALTEALERSLKTRLAHDPGDIQAARHLADQTEASHIGLFYRDSTVPCYDDYTNATMGMSDQTRLERLDQVLDQFSL